MGSPIASTVAEIFLQHQEHRMVKQWMEDPALFYYSRDADDVLIIYDTRHATADTHMNRTHKNIEFNLTTESNDCIDFLDLTIKRKNHELEMDIFRKPTTTSTTIHQRSNHPGEHKTAAYRYFKQRMDKLPLTRDKIEKKNNTIKQIATENGYPKNMIEQLINRTHRPKKTRNVAPVDRKWVTFTYFNPQIRQIANIFRNTKLQIAYRPTNTLSKYFMTSTPPVKDLQKSGVYEITCHTCNQKYIGQTSSDLHTRFTEHCRYIKSNNPKSAYAVHILNNQHEYGPASNTIRLIQQCNINKHLIHRENLHIQEYSKKRKLVQEQATNDRNILYDLATHINTVHNHLQDMATSTNIHRRKRTGHHHINHSRQTPDRQHNAR
jgi:hypothetical protein